MVVNKMKRAYIIEFGGEKEVDEMNALELNNIDSATLWILDSMQSDEEYFNIDINYQFYLLKYEQYDSETNFYAKALIYVEYEEKTTEEMLQSDCTSVQQIIESNLSIVSKIITRMVEE